MKATDSAAAERGLAALNDMADDDAKAAVVGCCAWPEWGSALLSRRPYASASELDDAAAAATAAISDVELPGVLSLFPPIAVDRGGETRAAKWSRQEESGVHGSEAELRADLVRTGTAYRDRFGYTFVIAATGLEGEQVLAAMKERLGAGPVAELVESRRQLDRICRMRVAKLLPQLDPLAEQNA